MIEEIKQINGVQYVTTFGSKVRVVFNHKATSNTIQEVENFTECIGQLGATQEHLPAVEYSIEELQEQSLQPIRVGIKEQVKKHIEDNKDKYVKMGNSDL